MRPPTQPSVNDTDDQRLTCRRLPARQVPGGRSFDAAVAVATVVVDRQTQKITQADRVRTSQYRDGVNGGSGSTGESQRRDHT